ncbi:MAG TPA: class I SAM-dependent methyltransferase [Candidatus Nanoarchaeia archaeon]|nr:class I SAM-dependent methyltransferase [Candidatus Nanoarchaeia archaeon]
MPKKKEEIQEKVNVAIQTYNKIASIYKEKIENKLLQFQLTKFVSMLAEKAKVLDAGSSCGRDSAYLKEDNLDVTSIDLSEAMIKEAKDLGVETLKEDLLKIKYDKEFDGIWCMATLADIEKKEAPTFIKNLNKALKDEGILYLAVKEGEGEHLIEKKEYENHPRFYAFYKKEELKKLLEENGFKILELTEDIDNKNKWLEVFARKN